MAECSSSQGRGGPLQGVRVVELTKIWAGPYTGKLLAYLGAEVIRIESLESLDVTRSYGVSDINNAPGFQAVNPEKLSVQIDMKKPEGVALILKLLAQSDILVENLRPGAVKRLGLGYEAVRKLKPDIVFVSMGMYGSEGPLAYQTGYAPCFAALGGVSGLVGYEDRPPEGMNIRYADSTYGAAAAYAAMVALLHRRRSGAGQFVDVSAVECMSSMIGDALVDFALTGEVAASDGTRHPAMAPHAAYPCQAGEWISIAVNSDSAWQALAAAINRPELAQDSRFATLAARKASEPELDRLVAAFTATQPARELAAALQQRGVAAAKSQSSMDLVADPQLWSRAFYRDVTAASGHSKVTVGPSWKMTREASVTAAAPGLGEHNARVLGGVLGLSAAEQQRLAEAGITR
jgi:crotonobetainyl-CoA:carnitine CoA-transferase CaiB-like acyl-CoA transferase